MRRTVVQQAPLVPSLSDHPHARELEAIGTRLDASPEIMKLVHRDLVKGVSARTGREGMTAEVVLRAAIAKQLNDWSYAELAFHLTDSLMYRWFCRLGIADDAPSESTLKRNIKQIRAETWEAINVELMGQAEAENIETGRMTRTDCTVVETNIHHPTDSSLLWDCVRVLVRLSIAARELVATPLTNHTKRAKRRALGILNAKSQAERVTLYQDLLKVTGKTMRFALDAAVALEQASFADLHDALRANAIAGQIRHYLGLAEQVVNQTRRRVLDGESVPASEKLVSIFEAHTDIIIKDRRETLYGHKVALTTGRSGLVIDFVVLSGNPADASLATVMVERQQTIYDRPPRQVTFDGAFGSKANLEAIKATGVEDVCFSKRRSLEVEDMVKSTWVYRKLRRFRAGIEAGISFLKRCFGMERCTWRSEASFRAYGWASVVSHNLLLLARHALA